MLDFADLARIDLDVDNPRVLRHDQPGRGEREQAEAHAEREDHVRPFAGRFEIGHLVEGAAIERMIARQQAVRGEIGEGRDAGRFDEAADGIGRGGGTEAAAEHDRWAFGRLQHRQRLGDGGGRGRRRGSLDEARDLDRILGDPAGEHVHRYVEQHRAARAGQRRANGLHDQPRNIRGRGDLLRPFGDRAGDRGLIDAGLQRVGFGLVPGGGAADVEHRRAIEIGRCRSR